MSVEMELISADTIRSVRIPEAATTAPVHVATDLKEWDVLVSVCAPVMSHISHPPLITHTLSTEKAFWHSNSLICSNPAGDASLCLCVTAKRRVFFIFFIQHVNSLFLHCFPPCASHQLALLQPAYFSPFALSAPAERMIILSSAMESIHSDSPSASFISKMLPLSQNAAN